MEDHILSRRERHYKHIEWVALSGNFNARRSLYGKERKDFRKAGFEVEELRAPQSPGERIPCNICWKNASYGTAAYAYYVMTVSKNQ